MVKLYNSKVNYIKKEEEKIEQMKINALKKNSLKKSQNFYFKIPFKV